MFRSPHGIHPSLPQPTTLAGAPVVFVSQGQDRAGGLASPVSTVKLHVQVSAVGVTASAPNRGVATAILTHPQHRCHGHVLHAELHRATVLAGDRVGEHRDSGDIEPP